MPETAIILQQYKLWNFAFGKSSQITRISEMPTVRDAPRIMTYPYFWKSYERLCTHNSAALVLLLNVFSPSLSSLQRFCHKKYFRKLVYICMQRSLKMLMLSLLFAAACDNEIMRKRSTIIYPLDPDWRSKPPLLFTSPAWDTEEGERTFWFWL